MGTAAYVEALNTGLLNKRGKKSDARQLKLLEEFQNLPQSRGAQKVLERPSSGVSTTIRPPSWKVPARVSSR